MGIKRLLEDGEFPEPSLSLPEQIDYNKRLNLNIEGSHIGGAQSNFCQLQYYQALENGDTDGAYVLDNNELEISAPLSLVMGTSFWPYFSGNGFTIPRRPAEQFQNLYISLLNGPPRKEVPIGPDYQAEIPMWDLNASRKRFLGSYYLAENKREQELEGTCIIPMPNLNDSTIDGLKAGRGRTDCNCPDKGSMRCVQQHVNEVREKLRESIGDENFVKLGFNEMGDEVARKWTCDEQQAFHEIVLSNRVIFWKHLRAEFPTRKMKELVSYYFNVFMLRRRAIQNRSFVLEIDSDDDEEQRDPDEGSYQNRSYSVDRDIGNGDYPQGQNGECCFVDGREDDDNSTVESLGDEELDASWVDEFWSEPEKIDGNNKASKQKAEKKDAFEMDGRKDVLAGEDTEVRDEPIFQVSSK